MIKPMEVTGTSPGGASVIYGGVRVPDGGGKQFSKIRQDAPSLVAQDEGSGAESLGQSLSTYGALNAGKEKINQLASDIRGLGEAKALVSHVQANLDLVVKNFPPFPPGSLEREQFLNSVAGIRSIIEQLTFPPEQKRLVSDSLSGQAFLDTNATDQMLSSGVEDLKKVNSELSEAQAKLSGEVRFLGGNQQDEAYYVAQSQGVGLALSRQHASISRDSKQILAALS